MAEVERSGLMLAIALLPTPSSRLIQKLEDMIAKSDKTSTLLLAYGSLVANAGPDQELKMVTFLTDRLPEHTPGNTNVLIHILHALGNTKSPLAIEYIMRYTQSDNQEVRLTVVSSLRFFTGLPAVQQQYLAILREDSTDSLVEAIINALRNGYDYNRDIVLEPELAEYLVKVTLKLENEYLQSELRNLFELMGVSATSLSDSMEHSTSRHRRNTANWDSTSSSYNIIASASQRAADVRDFPYHRGFLWSYTLGEDTGDYQIYVQAAAGLFAGVNIERCDIKVFGKGIIRAHALGYEAEILNIQGQFGRVYVAFVGSVILDVEIPSTYTYELPKYERTLFSVSYTFYVFGVPIVLGLEVSVSISGDLDLGLQRGVNNSIEGTGALTPYVAANIEGSAAISVLVSGILTNFQNKGNHISSPRLPELV